MDEHEVCVCVCARLEGDWRPTREVGGGGTACCLGDGYALSPAEVIRERDEAERDNSTSVRGAPVAVNSESSPERLLTPSGSCRIQSHLLALTHSESFRGRVAPHKAGL